MMATLIPKPKSSFFSNKVLKSKLRLFKILLATAAIICAAVSFGLLYKKCNSLQREVNRVKLYKLHQHHDSRISKLEIALANSEAKLFNQGELIKRLGQNFERQSYQPDIKAMNILQELEAHRDMYIKSEQKIYAYEQRLLALTQELMVYKDQNQLMRQEQARMRHEYQDLLKKVQEIPSQVNISQENLEKALESKLSQLANADYEHEEKLKDLQKAVESSAKIGELKALEVYYDDKISSLSHIVQNLNVKNSLDSQNLKQDSQKLGEESEEMKITGNKLNELKKTNEEDPKNVKPQLVEEPVQSLGEQHEETIKNHNMLSQIKSELKMAQKNLKELYRQMNQHTEQVSNFQPKQHFPQKTKPQKFKKEQKLNGFEKNQGEYESHFESDLQSLANLFVNLLYEM